jgi:GT2 family glycosyltransferase
MVTPRSLWSNDFIAFGFVAAFVKKVVMMNELIDVSVVICTRNRASILSNCLRSLAAVRSNRNWEVLIIDNASTDDTADVVLAADNCGGRMKFFKVDRIGLGAARDAAWRMTRGRFVAFTDDDCYVSPNYVDSVAQAFGTRPDIACVGGRILLYDPADARVTIDEGNEPRLLSPRTFVAAGQLQGANLAFRREALEAIGGLDPELGAGTPFPCEDVDAVAAVVWKGFHAGFDPTVVIFHHHGRRAEDLPRLLASYDRGRGAYYAKYILQAETRHAYIRGWAQAALAGRTFRHFHDMRSVIREWAGALRYLVRRSAVVGLIAFLCLGICVFLGLVLFIAARIITGAVRR